MALIKCPECGREVSTYADACPNCGFPMRLASEVASAYLAGAVDGLSAAASLIGANGVSVIPLNLTAGSFVKLGRWGGEDITWRVLDASGGRALVVAEKVIDCVKYHESYTDITWEGCSLRRWLNGAFLERAFDASERARIALSRMENPDNEGYGTRGGGATSDRVFCLSIDEAKRCFAGDSDRIAFPTAHARANGVTVNGSTGGSCWWLRSPGFRQISAAYVYVDGDVFEFGVCVNDGDVGVRPAMYLNL